MFINSLFYLSNSLGSTFAFCLLIYGSFPIVPGLTEFNLFKWNSYDLVGFGWFNRESSNKDWLYLKGLGLRVYRYCMIFSFLLKSTHFILWNLFYFLDGEEDDALYLYLVS